MKKKAIFTLFVVILFILALSVFICASDYTYNYEFSGESSDKFGTYVLISVAIGLLISGITMYILYRQLKSVKPQKNASSYIVNGSFDLSLRQDIFLYSTVTKTPKPKSNDQRK